MYLVHAQGFVYGAMARISTVPVYYNTNQIQGKPRAFAADPSVLRAHCPQVAEVCLSAARNQEVNNSSAPPHNINLLGLRTPYTWRQYLYSVWE